MNSFLKIHWFPIWKDSNNNRIIVITVSNQNQIWLNTKGNYMTFVVWIFIIILIEY